MPCTGTILPSESNNYRIRTCFTCQHSILSLVAQYLTPASKSKCLPSTHHLYHNFDRYVFFDILRWRCGYESISLVKKRLYSHLRLSITNIRAILYILHVNFMLLKKAMNNRYATEHTGRCGYCRFSSNLHFMQCGLRIIPAIGDSTNLSFN